MNSGNVMVNLFYYFTGGVFIFLNYFRHRVVGYRTPRTFSSKDIDRVIDYDFKVVDGWLGYLSRYTQESVEDKVIFELGSGPDLGIGLILLAMGAKKYVAIDVHYLLKQTPTIFYHRLLDKLKTKFPDADMNNLRDELLKCLSGNGQRLRHIVDPLFNPSKIQEKVDIVFSQAAFEHFKDVPKVIYELGEVLNTGSCLIALIDLKTHTTWIRDRDPLNIYRYNNLFYDLFKFKGSPNRIRASEYKKILEENGWHHVEIKPLAVVSENYLQKIKPSLSKKFRNIDSQEMIMLEIVLMARK